MVKYISTYTKGTLKRSAKELSNDSYAMFLCCSFFFNSDFLYKAYTVGTHLNCIDKSMQFKCLPTTCVFIKK